MSRPRESARKRHTGGPDPEPPVAPTTPDQAAAEQAAAEQAAAEQAAAEQAAPGRATSDAAPVDDPNSEQAQDAARRAQLDTMITAAAPAVAATGAALATTARLGRLLGRGGWQVARHLPGGETMQRELERLQHSAVSEARRRLVEADESAPVEPHPEELRAVALIGRSAASGAHPLRVAMAELLERAITEDRATGRAYLYGAIISQLVPEEARILAALSDGTPFAVLDVISKGLRGQPRTLLANASTVGRRAGIVLHEFVPTYLTRLQSLGLADLIGPVAAVADQYEVLATEAVVQDAVADARAQGARSVKLIRKTLLISALGREFWAACDPARLDDPAGVGDPAESAEVGDPAESGDAGEPADRRRPLPDVGRAAATPTLSSDPAPATDPSPSTDPAPATDPAPSADSAPATDPEPPQHAPPAPPTNQRDPLDQGSVPMPPGRPA